MSEPVRVTFVDAGAASDASSVPAKPGQTLLQAAHAAGLEIVATCGGRGRCRSCRVKILKGDVPPATVQDTVQLGHEAVRERFRLSCQVKLVGDCTVLVAPPRAEAGHQILGAATQFLPDLEALDSGVEKRAVVANAPTEEHHQTSDLDQVFSTLGHDLPRNVSLEVMRSLPSVLRRQKGLITITTFNSAIVAVEPGDTRGQKYGMAFDIGTTSIVGTLLDLYSGEQLAAVSGVNPQATYGGDLMSRIAFAQFSQKNLATLRACILNAINKFIPEACGQANVSPEHIYKIVIVGNTCMHHLFLGIDVSYVGLAPYAPVVRDPLVLPARELLLKAAPNACVCFLPIIAGFVGADTIGAVLATRIDESEKIRLVVDIGTNTEVVMGSRDKLMACSAPAGPAFEGGEIKHGMRAAIGAIEAVAIDNDVRCSTIADAPAIGICGSGLIDAVAKMLDAKILECDGVLRCERRENLSPALQARLRDTEHGPELVLVRSEHSGNGEDITITQRDIRQLQLAKGAICCAILMLQRVMGIEDDQIEELLLCGAFGNFVNVNSALRIRLFPPLRPERITYAGNAAHVGAEMALLSERTRGRAYAVAQRIEHVGLAGHPDFQDLFVESLGLCGAVAD